MFTKPKPKQLCTDKVLQWGSGSIALDKYTNYLRQLLFQQLFNYFSSLIAASEKPKKHTHTHTKPQNQQPIYNGMPLSYYFHHQRNIQMKYLDITNSNKLELKYSPTLVTTTGKTHVFQLLFLILLKRCIWGNIYQKY